MENIFGVFKVNTLEIPILNGKFVHHNVTSSKEWKEIHWNEKLVMYGVTGGWLGQSVLIRIGDNFFSQGG